MKIFELNNHAISLMCKGDYESALSALQAALSMEHELSSDDDMSPRPISAPAAMVLEKDEEIMPPSPEGSLPEALIGRRTGVVGGVEVVTSPFIEAGHTEDDESIATFQMYRRALLLSGDHPYGTPAVLLYNAGLLYHIQGLSKQIRHQNNSTKNTHYINKAIRFYSCAVDILDCGTDYFDVGHLMLALLNNLGHAKMHLADYEASCQFFKRLKLVLTAILVGASSAGTHQQMGTTRATMTDEECHLFLQNTLMLFCVHSDGKTFFTNAPAA